MNDYTKLDFIEYRIFDEGSICNKISVLNCFSDGILVYTEQKKTITVFCRILPDYDSDTTKIVNEITGLPLPRKSNYHFMCIESIKDAIKWNSTIEYIISCLNFKKGDFIRSMVFAKRTMGKEPKCLFVGAKDEEISKIKKEYLVQNITLGLPEPFRYELKCDSNDLVSQIRTWMVRTDFNDFRDEISKTVIGQDNLLLVLLSVYLYLKNIADDRQINKHNILLCGPSGCGKTETVRALKSYFKQHIPLLTISLRDTSKITSEGYSGMNTSYIVQEFRRIGSNGIGIVFLDEFDKRIIPDMNHGENVNAAIQAQLLTAVEGCMLDGVDTSKTMFIGMGSFDHVREIKAKTEKHRFGLGIESDSAVAHCDMNITREDMIEMGGLYELIGRFSCVVNYGSLSEEAIDKIVDLRLKEISEELGIPISVSDDMRAYLHANSNTPFGNRLIYSILREGVNQALLHILTNNIPLDEIELVITGKEEFEIKPAISQNNEMQKALEAFSTENTSEVKKSINDREEKLPFED